jgi:rhodanese-related sulfurtransferase
MDSKHLHSALAAGADLKLIDVRTPGEFAALHLAGSRLVPLDRLAGPALAALAAEPGQCVLVCRTGRRAEDARRRLAASGAPDPLVLDGGLDAWLRADFPVVRGKGVISLERQVRIAAGLLVLTGIALGSWIHPGFYALSGFVGAGLTFAGITDWCGMGMLLARMPWNQASSGSEPSA